MIAVVFKGKATVPQVSQRRRNTVASTIGNVLEWYDFAVYGALATTIGKLFFPADNALDSLLASFTVFAVGYAARPIGGILLGHIGDRVGRKTALILSITVMGIASLLVALLPTHAQIGSAAAICMVVLRLVQGLAVGGEYPASIVFLAEHAPDRQRGLFTSWPMFGSVLGFLLGVGSAALLNAWLGTAGVDAWGWRLLFFLGAGIAVLGAVLRSQLSEPAASMSVKQEKTIPIVIAFRDHWREILRIMGLTVVNAVGFYMLWAYATSYLTGRMHVTTSAALDINTFSLAAMAAMVPLAAMLADRIGRKPLLYFVALGTLVSAYPLWSLMHHQDLRLVLLAQTGFALLYAAGYAGLSAVMAEILPAGVRCSAASIGYNLCMAVFGGTTPLVATYLITRTSDDYLPAYYLMAAACISLVAVFSLKETAGKPLRR